MARIKYVQIESKNALVELLREGKTFTKIYLATNAFKDQKTNEIVALANKLGVQVEKVSRKSLGRNNKTGATESVVGLMEADNMWSLKELLDKIHEENKIPFFLVLDHVKYDVNIGAIMRTAYASGVNGVITPIDTDNLLNSETIRISMGASLRIPIVEMNLFSALKELKNDGVKLVGVSMEGTNYYDADLRGPVAFIVGAEDTGISTRVQERVDEAISIPMRENIGSLNVGVSAGVIMYEKLRQEVKAA
ncbi:MAG TPA: 23S rRNA (guanosine(2251)-2'-O)-methyltransferase RlmB [Candidatus Dojkabacteria bacterium]|nr:23S rRNA (guanosine(2251)-2'-O)-methyltransferase RlmB [Candidatus Dojkabacteria bacterium]